MAGELTRRTFVRDSVWASAGAAIALGAEAGRRIAQGAEAPSSSGPAPAKGTLPKGKIGNLEISRLLLGGNLLARYNHIRDLRYVAELVNRYNTDEKILETMALAESMGINAVTVAPSPSTTKLLKEHREKRGGKLLWIAYHVEWMQDLGRYGQHVQRMVDEGADAIYMWGEDCDRLVREGKLSTLAKAVEIIKAHNLPTGVGGHELRTIQEVEKNKVPCDFYVKTLHHLNYPSAKMDYDSIFCRHPAETIEFMKTVEKPWIGFKVMAGGAIPPQDGFKYALEGGVDFVLAGMFDFEIAPDVKIIKDLLAASPKRVRPWRA